MKDCKLYICTALFICITAVKLCFPEGTEHVSRAVKNMLSQNAGYGEAIQALGRSITGENDLVQVISELFNEDELVSAANMNDG